MVEFLIQKEANVHAVDKSQRYSSFGFFFFNLTLFWSGTVTHVRKINLIRRGLIYNYIVKNVNMSSVRQKAIILTGQRGRTV